jgi:hypothetical protein
MAGGSCPVSTPAWSAMINGPGRTRVNLLPPAPALPPPPPPELGLGPAVTVADLLPVLPDGGRCADILPACRVGGSTSVYEHRSATLAGQATTTAGQPVAPGSRSRRSRQGQQQPGSSPAGLRATRTARRTARVGCPVGPVRPGDRCPGPLRRPGSTVVEALPSRVVEQPTRHTDEMSVHRPASGRFGRTSATVTAKHGADRPPSLPAQPSPAEPRPRLLHRNHHPDALAAAAPHQPRSPTFVIMGATSPDSKIMTGFSAKIRPQFAEKHNMTLNKGRVNDHDHRRTPRLRDRGPRRHPHPAAEPKGPTARPTSSNKPRPAAPRPATDAGISGGSNGRAPDEPEP